jgi:2-phosphoglycerate kinase
VLKAKELKSRLRGRGVTVPQRRAKRYLKKFEAVWRLQSYLLSEADRCDVPIIPNYDKERAVLQVILQISHELSRHFDGTPTDVFGPVVEECGALARRLPWHEMVPHLSEMAL